MSCVYRIAAARPRCSREDRGGWRVPLLLNTRKKQERRGIAWSSNPQIVEDRSETRVPDRRGWKQVETVTRNPSAKLDRGNIVPNRKNSRPKWIRPSAASVLIPSPSERDSRRRFPNRREYDSPWQTKEVCHGGCGSGAGGLRCCAIARAGEAVCRCRSDPAPAGAGCGL